jgi:transcriptional regulator with XRE-family HTH domain
MASFQDWNSYMPSTDKPFYKELGKRIAAHRKNQDMTQTQLAEMLGISQQTLAHYEVGRLRISIELLTTLSRILSVSIEDLVEEPTPQTATKRGPIPLLQKQIEQLSHLPRAKQKFVSEMLDAVIQQSRS